MATVRKATPADADAIARIHVDSWRSTYYGMLPGTYLSRMSRGGLRAQWATRLAETTRSELTLVAEHDGTVAGFAVLTRCRDRDMAQFAAEVTMLYVHPTLAGAGLGTALMNRCNEILEARSYRWLVVWVVEANTTARGFYRHIGLRNDGQSRVDRFDGSGVRVVRYARPINPVIDFDELGRVTAR
jgi:L-amino acid N-acyltransferase YncA